VEQLGDTLLHTTAGEQLHHEVVVLELGAAAAAGRRRVCWRPVGHGFTTRSAIAAPVQWDRFDCPAGCGAYQYRHRTRQLRRLI
jgi:hypothetical protein